MSSRPQGRGRLRARAAQVRAWGVRGRTLTGGVVLAGALLLALALVGGVGGVVDPQRHPDPGPSHGTLTATQPQLQDALLTEQELPEDTEPSATPAPARTTVPPPAPTPQPAAEQTGVGELCRALLEGAADLSALAGLWQATPPQETTSRHTPRRDGATLDQLIGVFDTAQANEAYGQLREASAGCQRVGTTLDGEPVTVLLEELSWDRRESTSTEDAYAASVVVESEERTLTGWLALDRLGPVISVLRHLEPVGQDRAERELFGGLEGWRGDPDPVQTRRAALGKLQTLLDALRD